MKGFSHFYFGCAVYKEAAYDFYEVEVYVHVCEFPYKACCHILSNAFSASKKAVLVAFTTVDRHEPRNL